MTLDKLMRDYLSSEPKKRTCNSNLKRWLFEFDVKQPICDKCKMSDTWQGEKLVLQLDHIDGNNLNNEVTNLRILCPNCHSQTETYAGKNNRVKLEG